MLYKIQQKATVWHELEVDAETLEQALDMAAEQLDDGDGCEVYGTLEFTGEFWAANDDGDELELPEVYR
jgi:hypothetical protein